MDERYLKRAEDQLYGELAAALDMPRDQTVSYTPLDVYKRQV